MGRARGSGGAKSPSLFGRILCRHLESLTKKNIHATVDQLVDQLRSTYPHYARIKLQPFTKQVNKIILSSSAREGMSAEDSNDRENNENTVRKRRKEVDQSEVKLQVLEAQHIRKRNGDILSDNSSSSSSMASPSSSSGSSGDEVSTSEGARIDLTKSMLRENYVRKSKESGKSGVVLEDVELEVVESNRGKKMNLLAQKNKIGMKHGEGKEGDGLSAVNNSVNDEKGSNGPKFKDIGGMNGVIEELKLEVMVPLYHPQLPRRLGVKPMGGILFHGPPGCGKTKLAHAIANEAGVPFYKISATELVSGISGASEENIRDLFSKAYRTAPSIVFIDEIDAIAAKRESLQREMERRIVTQLMTCMDESNKLVNGYVLVIGATNRPDAIDSALRRPGRFDREIVLGVPDESSRVEILSVLACNLKLDGAFDIAKIARSTPGFVGADLAALTNKAGNLAMKRIIDQRKALLSREFAGQEFSDDWLRQPWSHEEVENLSITMADFEEAVKMVQPSSRREGFSAIPNVKWTDVGGLHSLRQEFDRYIVRRIKFPEDYEDFGVDLEVGFLLYGPPGCGKTLIAKAVANEAGANFIHIKGPELLNKYVGESELAVRTIFSRARTCSPCILFFDEVDALTTTRGKEGGWVVERLLNQLLIELDGAEQRHGVYVIGATNRPEVMDRAFLRPGRFGKLIYVPLPSPEERGMILSTLARKKPVDVNVDLMTISNDKLCENFSGADLSALMNEAAMIALEEKFMSPCVSSDLSLGTIKDAHFKKALKQISASVSNQQKLYYQRLSESFKVA